LPLTHRRSDGWNNLIEAIYAASQEDLHEVVLAFNHRLLRGCRAQKVSTSRFTGFDSVDEEHLAEFGIDIFWHKKRWLKHPPNTFSPIIPKAVNILSLSFYPGFSTEFIVQTLLHTNMDAVILQTYGSGTIPMGNFALIEAIKVATERGVILVAITQVIEGWISDDYANSRLSKLGIVSGGDMTIEAALAKLTVLLSSSLNIEEIKNSFATNIIGELTQKY
jgi:L-asparaginase/Glu-tRNA(Gln) amidotransferase subunit D